jgi:hypothetical protein
MMSSFPFFLKRKKTKEVEQEYSRSTQQDWMEKVAPRREKEGATQDAEDK